MFLFLCRIHKFIWEMLLRLKYADFFPGSPSEPTDTFKNSCSTKIAQQTAGYHELDVAQPQYF